MLARYVDEPRNAEALPDLPVDKGAPPVAVTAAVVLYRPDEEAIPEAPPPEA